MGPAAEFAENARVTVRFPSAFNRADDGESKRVRAELPVTVRFIVPEKPLMLAKVIIELLVEPCVMLRETREV